MLEVSDLLAELDLDIERIEEEIRALEAQANFQIGEKKGELKGTRRMRERIKMLEKGEAPRVNGAALEESL
jgi:hypothetical protein